jgi:hypothetical protein
MQLTVHPSESWFEFYRELQLTSSSHLGTCGQFGPGGIKSKPSGIKRKGNARKGKARQGKAIKGKT